MIIGAGKKNKKEKNTNSPNTKSREILSGLGMQGLRKRWSDETMYINVSER